MEHVSIMYNVCYLYAEFFFWAHWLLPVVHIHTKVLVTKPSSTELAGRSNKRFSSLCVRKAAKRHFHSFPSWCYNQKLYALSCFEFLSCKQTVPEKILSGRKFLRWSVVFTQSHPGHGKIWTSAIQNTSMCLVLAFFLAPELSSWKSVVPSGVKFQSLSWHIFLLPNNYEHISWGVFLTHVRDVDATSSCLDMAQMRRTE